MTHEEMLIGWMVFVDYQFRQGKSVSIPSDVIDELRKKGWVEEPEEDNWEGCAPMQVLPAGLAVADLNAAEWGIDPIPEDA